MLWVSGKTCSKEEKTYCLCRSFFKRIFMQVPYIFRLSITLAPYANRLLWWFRRRYFAQGFLRIADTERVTLWKDPFCWKTGTAKVWRNSIKSPKMFIVSFFIFVLTFLNFFHVVVIWVHVVWARFYYGFWPFR